MDPNNYATGVPLTPDELLEKGSEFQVEIDGLEADLEENKTKAGKLREKLKKEQAKVAKIFHAREAGKDLFELNAGEITDEAPDEDTLPLSGGEPTDEVETPEDGKLPLDEHGTPDGSMDSGYPAEQTGQIYTAKAPAGNTCTVKNSNAGLAQGGRAGTPGLWTGRVSGKPVAVDMELIPAFQLIESHVGAEEDGLDWTPTLEIEEASEADVDADLAGVDL